ncbi:adenylate cyclase type 10-like [Gallus gallus]|uniref:adenylate cyclase type 10-like n=1 Tax=Gallus gallus TaxID=9031 RepID=UPI001F00B2AD|nr:adenylate cyclase type 10-like [Gallus gallus]XP_046791886.1 adenylate cyclase type 10-like [Gallus gallus]
MMVAYPGVVSCDAETCAASRLPSYCFRALPKRNLKGVISPTTVYQYVGTTEKQQRDVGVAEERSPYGPLLGREAEIDRFECCLEAYEHLEEPHVLAFVGMPGSGKSHLLAELAILGRAAGHRVIAVERTEENLKQPFSAIHLLVARALGLQFPITDEVCRMRHTEWNSAFHLTCTQVLQKVLGGEFGIFFVDNAHFVDSESWSIMWPLLQSVTVLMVMSLAPGP